MPLNQTFDLDLLAARYAVYSRLRQYYQGDVSCGTDIIRQIGEYLNAAGALTAKQNAVLENIEKLHTNTAALEKAEFDYNRLFTGPGKLLAPPYESAYLNKFGLVMQEETLAVRKWYGKNFIKVGDKNVLPDDHLGLELEFICYLLSQAGSMLSKGDKVRAIEYLNDYAAFFQNHIKPWIYRHLEDVEKNAKTEFCAAVALFTADFLKLEEGEG